MIKPILDEVLADLGIDGKHVTIETAMSAPDSETMQIRIADASGDSKAVMVDLRDPNGRMLSDDEIRKLLRTNLATFKEPSLY